MSSLRRLNSQDAGFSAEMDALLAWDSVSDEQVHTTVREIIKAVRQRGDEALIEYTNRFDRMSVSSAAELMLPKERLDAALVNIPQDQRDALERAAERVRSYHERQKDDSWSYTEADGTLLGQQITPMDRVGLYVPGGKAAYPSSVLMNAIPAKVAGVPELVMVVPTPDGQVNELVLAAAAVSGVDKVFTVGGAQAVAAMAYGTDTIQPVDKITGPGNAFVAAAKRRVFGKVGIDMIAGPSEILVIADKGNDPDWIALDLLSQAEHDESAQSILITDDVAFGQAVAQAVEARLETLDRRAIAGASWRDYGAVITVRNLGEAARLSNRVAPEHLELCVADPDALAEQITHAGALFLGQWTPEAIGDYVGGPNHVLPTARSARFSSGLSVMDFLKRTTIAKMTPEALKAIGPAAETLATSESLQAHGLSVRARLDRLNEGAGE